MQADISLPKGVYYINWNIQEEHFEGLTESYYDPPVKTLIEVSSIVKAKFIIDSIGTVIIGQSSRPISISTENPPNEYVKLKLTLGNPSEYIDIYPPEIEFTNKSIKMYFKISISDDMPSEEINPNTLNIEISGTDAQAYSVI